MRLYMWQSTPLSQDLSWSLNGNPPPAPPAQVEWACSMKVCVPAMALYQADEWEPATYRGFSATVLHFTLKQWPPFDLEKAVHGADSDSVDSVLGRVPKSDSVNSVLGPDSNSDSESNLILGPEEHQQAHAGSGPSVAHDPVAREGQGPARVFQR